MPLAPNVRVVGGYEKKAVTVRLGRLVNQSHPGLLRGSTRLPPVTGHTGTNYIFPGMLPITVPGNNMVQSKLSALLAAILADIVVTPEDLKPSQLPPRAIRTSNQGSQPDY